MSHLEKFGLENYYSHNQTTIVKGFQCGTYPAVSSWTRSMRFLSTCLQESTTVATWDSHMHRTLKAEIPSKFLTSLKLNSDQLESVTLYKNFWPRLQVILHIPNWLNSIRCHSAAVLLLGIIYLEKIPWGAFEAWIAISTRNSNRRRCLKKWSLKKNVPFDCCINFPSCLRMKVLVVKT